MTGYEPYMPKMERTSTGKGTLYVAPILPVRVKHAEQMRKPKKTMGIVSRAVNPILMTDETVEASGGASMSDVQYAQYSCQRLVALHTVLTRRILTRAPHVRASGFTGSN